MLTSYKDNGVITFEPIVNEDLNPILTSQETVEMWKPQLQRFPSTTLTSYATKDELADGDVLIHSVPNQEFYVTSDLITTSENLENYTLEQVDIAPVGLTTSWVNVSSGLGNNISYWMNDSIFAVKQTGSNTLTSFNNTNSNDVTQLAFNETYKTGGRYNTDTEFFSNDGTKYIGMISENNVDFNFYDLSTPFKKLDSAVLRTTYYFDSGRVSYLKALGVNPEFNKAYFYTSSSGALSIYSIDFDFTLGNASNLVLLKTINVFTSLAKKPAGIANNQIQISRDGKVLFLHYWPENDSYTSNFLGDYLEIYEMPNSYDFANISLKNKGILEIPIAGNFLLSDNINNLYIKQHGDNNVFFKLDYSTSNFIDISSLNFTNINDVILYKKENHNLTLDCTYDDILTVSKTPEDVHYEKGRIYLKYPKSENTCNKIQHTLSNISNKQVFDKLNTKIDKMVQITEEV